MIHIEFESNRIYFSIWNYSRSAPFSPETILREFRATADKRLSDSELVKLLKAICFKRSNHNQILSEILYILER